jgi:hypothetical protein
VIAELLARVLRPRSYCFGCGRPWFSDKRRPCNRCGAVARRFDFAANDGIKTKDSFH